LVTGPRLREGNNFKLYDLGYHLFADDKQMIYTDVYTHVLPGEEAAGLHKRASCISELQAWCASRRLQLNAAKTDPIWFGSRAALHKSSADRSLTVNSVVIHPIDVVRDLGVLLDSEVTMKPHINKLGSTYFYHLRRLRELKRHVNRDMMKQLVSALILSRIDYCNSVLVGLPWSTIAPLQRVQNAAARLVMGLSARNHVGPALRELHWLPLAHRIKFKVELLMYMAHNRLSPLYISEMLAPVSSTLMHRQLRSSGSSNYTVPRTRTKLGDWDFSVAGPVIWNSIPESVRSVDNEHTFKRLLKTHFFNQLNWFYVTSFSCYFNCFMLHCID